LNDEVGKKLYYALRNGGKVEIVYSGGTTPMNRRTIKPIEIFEKNGVYYVESLCDLRKEPRIFRIDRITEARLIGSKQATNATSPPSSTITYTDEKAFPDSNSSHRSNVSSGTMSPSHNKKGFEIPDWIWFVGLFFLLYLCSK